MDQTLKSILEKADEFHDKILSQGLILHSTDIEEQIKQLATQIRILQGVSRRLADVSNVAQKTLIHKQALMAKKIAPCKTIDPYPKNTDHVYLRLNHDTKIQAKRVESIDEIPINNLYYIESLKQYAININGVVIKGALANLVKYGTPQSARCSYGLKCRSFLAGHQCNYYHDPEDYIALNRAVPDIPRNFTIGSFIYNKKDYHTRHIGSYDTLDNDLYELKKIQYQEEVNNREGQLIHDLLIYLILCQTGYVSKYLLD